MEKSTRFAFTVLRPTEEDVRKIDNLKDCGLCFYGIEIAPESKLVHLQGYLELDKPMELFKLKHLLGCYCEVAESTRIANYDYCRKDGHLVVLKCPREYIADLPGILNYCDALDNNKKYFYTMLDVSSDENFVIRWPSRGD